jgi:hypothetical protein
LGAFRGTGIFVGGFHLNISRVIKGMEDYHQMAIAGLWFND